MSCVDVQTLEYAAVLLGGSETLAQRLQVTRTELNRWLTRNETPPVMIFLRAVDIVEEAAVARLAITELEPMFSNRFCCSL